jgi:BlaR1 peptidase M56
MKRYPMLFVAAALVVGGCAATLMTCPGGPCAVGPGDMVRPAAMIAGLGLLGAASLAVLARTVWLLLDARLSLRRLHFSPAPTALAAVMDCAGVAGVRFALTDVPLAFASGGFKPAIIVSSGTVRLLKPNELAAVLLHEAEHARHRDPLVRAFMKAASEVLFVVPLIGWMAERRLDLSELRADRAALRRLGPVPVAGALLALNSATQPQGLAAFAGAPRPRLAQLLGEPRSNSAPPAHAWGLSAVSLSFVFAVAWCLAWMAAGI